MKPVSKSVCVKGQEYDRDKKTDPKKSIYNCSFFISSSSLSLSFPPLTSYSFFLTSYSLFLSRPLLFLTYYLLLVFSPPIFYTFFPYVIFLFQFLVSPSFITSYLDFFHSPCHFLLTLIPFRISLFSEIHFSFLFLIFFIHISLIHLFFPQFYPQFIHSFRLFQSHAVSCQVENEAVTV